MKNLYNVTVSYTKYNKQYDNCSFCNEELYFLTGDIEKIQVSLIFKNCDTHAKLTKENITTFKKLDETESYFLMNIRKVDIIHL
jgi:hypothetical protein